MSRIINLPRRDWKTRVAPYIEPLSDLLRAPGGQQTLRPAQAAILLESAEQMGCFANGRVGIGKSLATALSSKTVARRLGGEVRALILCPGGILTESIAHFSEMREHWQLPHPSTFVQMSYDAVSRMPGRGESLEDLFGPGRGPNVIICDESDALRNVGPGGSARARQIEDWVVAHPETIFIVVTGTCDVEGICDYGHLMEWALRERSPLPRKAQELRDWSEVIDAGCMEKAQWVCQDLGIPEDSSLEDIRFAFRRRVYETPGVIIADDPYTGSELVVREHVLEDPALDPHFERLRDLWQRPDGIDLVGGCEEDDADKEPDRIQGSTIWSVARRMGRGLCYVWDPLPPEDWLKARRRYFGWVRAQLERGWFYTELTARRHAIERGISAWTEWEVIRDTYQPQQRTLWLSDAALRWAEAWGREEPGIVWVEDVAFGVELARRTGWPYFQGKGKSACGRRIPSGKGPRSKETIIASRKACGTGLNLQYRFNRSLIVTPLNKSRDFEQLVGRTHREGQPEAQVFVDILLTCAEDRASMAKMLHSAKRTAESLYSQKAALYTWPRAEYLSEGRAWK